MPLAITRPHRVGEFQAQPAPPLADTAFDRVIKLIPVDVVTVYMALQALQPSVASNVFQLVSFAVCACLVPLILYLDGRYNNAFAPAAQYVFRTAAFVAWALAIGNPFAGLYDVPRWPAALAAVVLPVIGERLVRSEPQP